MTNVTRYQYDEAGNQLNQIDALNRTNTFVYDSMGRRTQHSMPGTNRFEGLAYDTAGNLVYQTNFNGAIITNLYDMMNRLTNRASVAGYAVSFAYSPTGQRTNMTDASGTTRYTYDSRDRLQLKTVVWSGEPTISLNYRFDANGNLTNLWSSTSGGVTNAYQYDALSRLTNVLANGSAAAGYGFDFAGNLQTMRYGNGVTNQYQYDGLNRLTNAGWKLNASTLASFSYQLGLTGTRTNLSETINGTSRTYGWTYDPIYRMTNENIRVLGNVAYGYDAVANRTNRTSTISGLTNQLSPAYNTNDWLTSDSYDYNGNTTGSSGNSYQYDALNHVTNVNSGTVLMSYDGDGNRASKKIGGVTTYYLLDDRNPSGYVQVLEEYQGSSLSRVYNYGLGLISQRVPNTTTNYFVYDGHGSTRMLTDAGGNFVNAFAYDAYGTLIASNSSAQTFYLYCGQQFDPDLGLYYNRARYLNPNTGRFRTGDTEEGDQEAPLSLHRYLYVADNPVNHRDPSGHDIEGSLDVMDMMSTGFGMQSPVIGSGRGTATAIALGTGGPEIKGILDRTLTDVGTTFNTWTTRQKQAAAAMIGGGDTGIANSWDIAELHNVDPSLNTLYVGKGYSCGTGNYKATVAVNGSVYYADAANYALWGKMYQLVHDWYIKDWGGDTWYNPGRGFDLAAAQSFVKQWKLFRYGAITGEHRSEALMFTAYGYNGTLGASGLVGVAPSGQTVTEPLFTWRWMPNHP